MLHADRHIVFDWNSTLLDDIDALCHSTNLVIGEEGHQPVSLAFFQEHYSVPFRALYQNLGLDATQVERLIARQNDRFHHLYEPLANKADLRDGALEILTEARAHGVKNYILSNHLVEPIRLQLKRLGIDTFFETVLAYADATVQFKHMTKGEHLKQFRTEHGLTGDMMMIVGDSVEEVEIAHEQGLISVALTGGCVSEKRLKDARPDYLIHTLRDLDPILRERGFVS